MSELPPSGSAGRRAGGATPPPRSKSAGASPASGAEFGGASSTAVPAAGASAGATLTVVAVAVAIGAVILIGGGVVLGVVLTLRFDGSEDPLALNQVAPAPAAASASEFAQPSYWIEDEPSYAYPDSEPTVPETSVYEPMDEEPVLPATVETSEPPMAVEEPASPAPSPAATASSILLTLITDLPWIQRGRNDLELDRITLAEGLPEGEVALELIGPAVVDDGDQADGFHLDGDELQLAWTNRDPIRGDRRDSLPVGTLFHELGRLEFSWSDELRRSDDVGLVDAQRRLLNSLRLHVLALSIGPERFYLPLTKPIAIQPIAIAPPATLQGALPELDLELPAGSGLYVSLEPENIEAIEPMSYVDQRDETGNGGSVTVNYDDETGETIPMIVCRYGMSSAGNSLELKIETAVDFGYVPPAIRSPYWKQESPWASAAAEIARLEIVLSKLRQASEERLLAATKNSRYGYSADLEMEAELEAQVATLETAARIAAVQQDLLARLKAEPLRARVSVVADYSHDGEQIPPVTIFTVPSPTEGSDPPASSLFGDQ